MKKFFLLLIVVYLFINYTNALSETEQIIAANFLAKTQIINDYSWSTDQYRINDNISRKEVMKIIINSYEWYKWDIKGVYKCSWKYKDVVDDWGCKYIEKSLNEGIIEKWENFRPDDSITISETLKLIFKIKKTNKTYNSWDWWKDYIDTAYDLWWIYDKNIDWTVEAKRWFIFLTLANAGYYFEDHKNWKIEFKENMTDFYGIDFNLKTINSNKYELVWENLSNDINSIEILSCKDNFSDIYDSNWYVLKSYKFWNTSFKYIIDKNFNNYCKIPYKVKLNYISGETKIIDLNLNIPLFRNFTNKSTAEFGYPDEININTLKILKNYWYKVIIDKNHLYLFNSPCYPEAYSIYYKIDNYLSYNYIWNLLIWDNYVHDIYWKKLFSIDQDTFVEFWTWYYSDKDNFYQKKSCYDSSIIWKKDKEFNILSEKVYNYDWKYYYLDKGFEVWDRNTFEVVNNTWNTIENWLTSYRIFAKDKDYIYFESLSFLSLYENKFKWDYTTFKVMHNKMGNYIWIDKYSLYYISHNWKLNQYLNNFDLESFKMDDEEGKTFSDNNWIYYLIENEWIVSFDKIRFNKLWNYILYDSNNIYIADKKVSIDAKDFEIIDSKLNILRVKDKIFVIIPNYMAWNFLWENRSNTFLLDLVDYLNWETNDLKRWNIYENVDLDTFEKISEWKYKDKNKLYDFINDN